MNFNYDLITWIKYFIGSFACCFSAFLCGKYLLKTTWKEIKLYNVLFIVIFAIFLIFNSLVFDNIMKLFGTLLVFFCIYKFSLNTKVKESFIMAIGTCVIYMIGEITFIVSVSFIDFVLKTNIAEGISKACYSNIVIGFLSYLYTCILKKFVIRIVNIIKRNNKLSFIILGIITIIVVLSSVNKLYINNWKFSYVFFLNIIIIAGCLGLFLILLKQYLKNKEITDKYMLLKDYLKTSAELIEKYSITVHKYKNNLIAIKGYLKNDNKKADNYINSLLETYDSKKYNWINKINIIQLDAIRYLIYYKLSKAENNNLKILVDVSNDIKAYDNDILSIHDSNVLLDIIGELFDNAIYASKESKKKEINLIIYEENQNIKFIISNTYKGSVDLSLINKNGYTTKGNGHGLGLYDIDKTIKKHDIFDIKYELINNYFIANLAIKAKK